MHMQEPMNQHQTTLTGPPRSSGVSIVVATDDATPMIENANEIVEIFVNSRANSCICTPSQSRVPEEPVDHFMLNLFVSELGQALFLALICVREQHRLDVGRLKAGIRLMFFRRCAHVPVRRRGSVDEGDRTAKR